MTYSQRFNTSTNSELSEEDEGLALLIADIQVRITFNLCAHVFASMLQKDSNREIAVEMFEGGLCQIERQEIEIHWLITLLAHITMFDISNTREFTIYSLSFTCLYIGDVGVDVSI